MKTQLQLWKSMQWQCPNCKSHSFAIMVETKIRPTSDSIFQGELIKRVRIACRKCKTQFEESNILRNNNAN